MWDYLGFKGTCDKKSTVDHFYHGEKELDEAGTGIKVTAIEMKETND
jgi:hypothetical protein